MSFIAYTTFLFLSDEAVLQIFTVPAFSQCFFSLTGSPKTSAAVPAVSIVLWRCGRISEWTNGVQDFQGIRGLRAIFISKAQCGCGCWSLSSGAFCCNVRLRSEMQSSCLHRAVRFFKYTAENQWWPQMRYALNWNAVLPVGLKLWIHLSDLWALITEKQSTS